MAVTPKTAWGSLAIEETKSLVRKRWPDSGESHDLHHASQSVQLGQVRRRIHALIPGCSLRRCPPRALAAPANGVRVVRCQ